ncbi:MAG: hypothetical protein WC209_10170 [Ignavibacteriaceae bacterium]
MLHSKSLAIVFTLLLCFLISSCNKSNVVSPDDLSPQKQLSKIVQDANNYSTFSYSNNKLSKYENIFDSKLFRSITLNYEGNNRPQTENYKSAFGDLLKKYYYDSTSKLDSMDFLLKDTSNNYIPEGHLKYYYNSLNQLIKMEQYDVEYKLLFTTENNYNGNGNIVESKFYDSNGLREISTKTYDNKTNPWYNLKEWLNYDISKSKNNLLSSNTTFSNNSQENTVTTYTYTYDSDGYPISRIIEFTSNKIKTTITETYEYQ